MFSRREWFYIWTLLTRQGLSDEWIAEAFHKDVRFITMLREVDSWPAEVREQWITEDSLTQSEVVIHRLAPWHGWILAAIVALEIWRSF